MNTEELQENIETQRSLSQQYAIRYAETNDNEERIKYQRHNYCLSLLINLLPK